MECAPDRRVVALQVRIAVEHKKRICQFRQCPANRAAGASCTRTIKDVPHTNTPSTAIADGVLDLLAQVACQDDDIGEAVTAKQLELMAGKWLTADVDKRLR